MAWRTENYNLLDEGWIPVLYSDGKFDQVGIKTVLNDAHLIRQIATSNPMDRVAILRILLALLYWCKGNPPEGGNTASNQPFSPEWFSKLDENRKCFNLLGNGKRFYQYKRDSDKPTKTANYLIHEIPTGTNFNHFRHSTDDKDGLCPACCAIGLLRLPVFATSGGRGMSPGINKKPPVYVVPIGATLAVTLRLSWQSITHSDLGTPTWEKPEGELTPTGDVPLLTGLTWLPRRVWLEDPTEPAEKCISCGRKELLIRKCVFAGLGGMKEKTFEWKDPHVIPDLSNSNTLDSADASAGDWAEITRALLKKQKTVSRKKWLVVDFATVKNDKYLEATARELVLPELTNNQRNDQIARMEAREGMKKNFVKATKKVLGDLEQRRLKTASRKHNELEPIFVSICAHPEAGIAAKTNELIGKSEEEWKQVAWEKYEPMIEVVAKLLSPGFTVSALEKRNKILGKLRVSITGKSLQAKDRKKRKSK